MSDHTDPMDRHIMVPTVEEIQKDHPDWKPRNIEYLRRAFDVSWSFGCWVEELLATVCPKCEIEVGKHHWRYERMAVAELITYLGQVDPTAKVSIPVSDDPLALVDKELEIDDIDWYEGVLRLG